MIPRLYLVGEVLKSNVTFGLISMVSGLCRLLIVVSVKSLLVRIEACGTIIFLLELLAVLLLVLLHLICRYGLLVLLLLKLSILILPIKVNKTIMVMVKSSIWALMATLCLANLEEIRMIILMETLSITIPAVSFVGAMLVIPLVGVLVISILIMWPLILLMMLVSVVD